MKVQSPKPCRKPCKKSQVSMEAALVIGFSTLILIVFLGAIADDIIRATDDRYKKLLEDLADYVEGEASVALASADGYYHSFTLPVTLNGYPYRALIMNSTNLKTDYSEIVIKSGLPKIGHEVVRVMPKEFKGNIVRGKNEIYKHEGNATVRPYPLTPEQIFDCQNPGPPQCGVTSLVTKGECCDHIINGNPVNSACCD